jgi:hypothetical protein
METIDLKPGEPQNQAHKYDLILTAIGLSFILILLMMGNQALGLILSAGWLVLPAVFRGISYFLKKSGLNTEHYPHLKINETMILDKKAGFWAKKETTCWNDVKKLEIKLFEVELMTHSGQAKKIDLNLLPDEDLKYVKEYLSAIKKTKGI